MDYRTLGNTGVKVSTIGVGCNRFGSKVDREGTRAIIHRALEAGINFFDTADTYGNRGGSEDYMGDALVGQWDKIVLATKGRSKMGDGPNDEGASRYHIQNAVEASLRRLKTDHIDLYQIHSWDGTTPLEETMRALDDLVRAGKVRYIGASNFDAWQMTRANAIAEMRGWEAFVTVQPEYHMLERAIERELIPYCQWARVGILPYFPLAGGFLTGKYKKGEAAPPGSRGESSPYVQKYFTDANFNLMDKLAAFAQDRGHTVGELAIAWLLGQPQVCCVISGATTPEQVTANAATAGWALTADELKEIRGWLE